MEEAKTWATVSCWQIMSLALGLKGSGFRFKVQSVIKKCAPLIASRWLRGEGGACTRAPTQAEHVTITGSTYHIFTAETIEARGTTRAWVQQGMGSALGVAGPACHERVGDGLFKKTRYGGWQH